jgi:hypothetical protein
MSNGKRSSRACYKSPLCEPARSHSVEILAEEKRLEEALEESFPASDPRASDRFD